MTQQSMPNPIELYEGAVQYMRPIIAGVKPGQQVDTTPCTEWNVQELLNHNIKVAQMTQGMFTGGGPVNPMEVSGPLPPEGAAESWEAGTAAVPPLIPPAPWPIPPAAPSWSVWLWVKRR